MRKLGFCICKNKDAGQLRGNHKADQRLCFRYKDSTIPPLLKYGNFNPLAVFCGCTAQFVSDLVRNPEDRFSHNEAHFFLFAEQEQCIRYKSYSYSEPSTGSTETTSSTNTASASADTASSTSHTTAGPCCCNSYHRARENRN